MSLALSTLFYEWRRYTAAVVALAFSGLLILAQVGMFTGIVSGITATIDRSRADVIVMGPKVEAMVDSGPGAGVPGRVLPLIYLNPNVTEVQDLQGNGSMWMNNPPPGQKRKTDFVQIWTVDTRPGAVTLPTDYTEATRVALLEPLSVAIDRTSLARLGVKLNDSAVINGRTVRVRAVLDGYPSINQATVVMSRDSYRMLGMKRDPTRLGPLMVRIKDPAKAPEVRDQLNKASGGLYRAWTRSELSKANEGSLMKEQIIGVFLGFSVFLGFLIGVGITSQTLRGAVLANIKELASLRALGVSMGSLRKLVLELSIWVGVVGLAFTFLFTWLISLLAQNAGVPMGFPMTWIVSVSILLLVISVVSGALSLGVLKKSQPADLLR
ncbi:ABC transporter permease [Phenylobacterium soli]|uniref:ABC transporter permease n=1 Tax=Phenylobacterium soli TaxID=2170551 RepID=A0A328AIM2_9CAUL|nr:ABC transporter permease [Phenylobacterium soli]RAK54630.1 ABC transporter permease [Phenylobacterium soli]